MHWPRWLWGAIAGVAFANATPVFAFNYEREVGGFFQKYYNWDPTIYDYSQYPNPYIGALTRLRVNDFQGATRWAASGAPNATVGMYAKYIAFVSAMRAKDMKRAKGIESQLLAFDNAFMNQMVALEWVEYELNKKNYDSAKDRISALGRLDRPSEADERLLSLKVKKGVDSISIIEAVTGYRELRAYYPESDRSGLLLDTMRRRFGVDFRLEELLNTPELRSAYCDHLFEARQYRTLIQFAELTFPRRFDFGDRWPYILREVGIAYMELGQFEKARSTFFILYTIPNIDPALYAEALTYHSVLVTGSGTPFYDDGTSTKALQSVTNDTPLLPIAPRAFYELSRFFMNENQLDELSKVLRQFRRFYNETEPYLLRISWEQQIRKINDTVGLEYAVLDSRFKTLIGNPVISRSMLGWLQSRFRSARKTDTVPITVIRGFRTVPLSYHAAWALKEWGGTDAYAQSKAKLLNDPVTLKYDALFQMGLGELAMREIEYMSQRRPSEILKYNRIRMLLKMQRFGRAIEQAKVELGTPGADLYRIPPGWIDMLYPQVYWDQIQKECKKYDLDPYFVLAILREDSRFEYGEIQTRDTTRLFKIKSSTLKDVSIRLGDPWTEQKEFMTPERAIRYAVFYIAWLRDNFDNNLLYTTMAYGTNPELAAQLIHKSNPLNHGAVALMKTIPYPETRDYIQRVLDSYVIYSLLYPNPSIKFKPWKLPDETH